MKLRLRNSLKYASLKNKKRDRKKSPCVHVSWKEINPNLANPWQLTVKNSACPVPGCLKTPVSYSCYCVSVTGICIWHLQLLLIVVTWNTVFLRELWLSILHTIEQTTTLSESTGPIWAMPEWVCGSHKLHRHPGPTWEIKVPYFSPIWRWMEKAVFWLHRPQRWPLVTAEICLLIKWQS